MSSSCRPYDMTHLLIAEIRRLNTPISDSEDGMNKQAYCHVAFFMREIIRTEHIHDTSRDRSTNAIFSRYESTMRAAGWRLQPFSAAITNAGICSGVQCSVHLPPIDPPLQCVHVRPSSFSGWYSTHAHATADSQSFAVADLQAREKKLHLDLDLPAAQGRRLCPRRPGAGSVIPGGPLTAFGGGSLTE